VSLFLILYFGTVVLLTNEIFRRRARWPQLWEHITTTPRLTAGLAVTAMTVAMGLDLLILALLIGGIL
jgi:hypothetical protein